MARELVAIGPASTETETKRNMVQAVKETAKHLGNRPPACRKYYIHPAISASYNEQTIFPALRNVPDDAPAARGKLSHFERAVLRLVGSSEKTRATPRKIAA